MIEPTSDFIKENYKKTVSLIETVIPSGIKRTNMLGLFTSFMEGYALSPASSSTKYYYCFPGGLCFYNLCLLKLLNKFNKTLELNISPESLLTICLLHNFGKIGDGDNEYYLSNDSQWHKDRGMLYTINPDIQYMKIGHRSLFLAQEYGITLTQDEYIAIMLHDDSEVNEPYKYKQPPLSTLLRTAVQWVNHICKDEDILKAINENNIPS